MTDIKLGFAKGPATLQIPRTHAHPLANKLTGRLHKSTGFKITWKTSTSARCAGTFFFPPLNSPLQHETVAQGKMRENQVATLKRQQQQQQQKKNKKKRTSTQSIRRKITYEKN